MSGADPRILHEPLTDAERRALAAALFVDMFKVVIDVVRGLVVAGGEFHADGERLLLEDGSRQADVWGANYYLARPDGDRIEYTAMINLYPARGNRTQEVQSSAIRERMRVLLIQWVGPA